MKKQKIRYAVVGLGHIAQAAVLPAFKNCKFSELTALVSTDPKKLEFLGRKYRIKTRLRYESYDECLENGEIDAVYIALPNHLHKEATVRAAEKGIHVLCEKPMAVSASDCEEMIRSCDKNQVKLMIAYRLHFEAANLRAIELIHRKNKIGNPRIFQSIHSQPTKPTNIRTLPVSQGGGPTYDIGIYDINAARYLFQDEPVSVFAECGRINKPAFRNIEESMSVILKFPQERLASIIYSFGTITTDTFRVVGTQGSLSLDPAYTYHEEKHLQLSTPEKLKEQHFKTRDQFSPEFDYFSKCIQRDLTPEPSGLEGLADIRIIEAIYRSAEIGKRVDLIPVQKLQRPSLRQEIDRPERPSPQVFHAESPTQKKAA